MLSRRDVLFAGLAGVFSKTLLAVAPQPRTSVSFAVPAGACDCHVHIFGEPAKYPFFAGRVYTPPPAGVDELLKLHQALHMERVVVVQPSVYGTDNSCTLDAVRQLGSRARGVVVIDDKTPDSALDAMGKVGIRGIRLNLTTAGINDPAVARQRFQSAVERVKGRNWHIQINTQPKVIDAISDLVLASPVTIVVDHFGGPTAASGVNQPGYGALLNLVKTGKAYVKISGAFDLMSKQAPNYPDVMPFAHALIAANSQRILWGTNWPHPDSSAVPGRKNTDNAPPINTDDGQMLNALAVWVPDPAMRRTILVDNPARIYGF
ncbi:MAG: amidohydrolase family protein [Vicinamibacterales bacterium]|nr:amidohydrolase family protein [Vicinamibacterales bacterium]